ncbi:F-box associated domain containing protein [Tanacetum coccineum]
MITSRSSHNVYVEEDCQPLSDVKAENANLSDEVENHMKGYLEDSIRLQSNLEGLSSSLEFIQSQEILELNSLIEKKHDISKTLENLDYTFRGYCFFSSETRRSKTGLEVIEYEGNQIRLSLRTYIPDTNLPEQNHELALELLDDTQELRNAEVFLHEFSLLPMPQNKNSLEISIEYEDKDEMTVAHMVDGVDANSGLKLFSLKEIFTGFLTFNTNANRVILNERESAMADMKFTYVVSCQLYGAQKKSSADYPHSCYANILDLMLTLAEVVKPELPVESLLRYVLPLHLQTMSAKEECANLLEQDHDVLNCQHHFAIHTSYLVGHLGFGYDELSHDYKVVITAIEPKMPTIIYSLKTGKWKEIGHFPCGSVLNDAKFSNGALHWATLDESSPYSWKIVSLDLANETYGEVLQPEYHKGDDYLNLGVMGEWLCVLNDYCKSPVVDVWVMKVYGVKDSWTKLASILYPH